MHVYLYSYVIFCIAKINGMYIQNILKHIQLKYCKIKLYYTFQIKRKQLVLTQNDTKTGVASESGKSGVIAGDTCVCKILLNELENIYILQLNWCCDNYVMHKSART